MLEIDTKLLTTYHPQIDGQTERMNQDLEQYLRMFIDHQQEQWSDWLVIVLHYQKIFCRNVAWDTNYNPGFHYWNPLQRPPISPRHNLDPRLGTSIRQWPSCHMPGKHIPQEARLMSQHQDSQIQTINVEALEIRGSEIGMQDNFDLEWTQTNMIPRQQIKSLPVTSDPITTGLSQETDMLLDDNCIADV